MAANHVGLCGSPRPQKQKDWAVCGSKKNQSNWWRAEQQEATCSFLGVLWGLQEKGVWWADGGSGEGGLAVSCQDCMCEGSSSRADNGLKLFTEKDTVPAKISRPPTGNTMNQDQPSPEAPTQCSHTCSSQHIGIVGTRDRKWRRIEERKSIAPTMRCFCWGGRVEKATLMPVFFGIWVDACQYLQWIEACMKVILMSRNCDSILHFWAMSYVFIFLNYTESTFLHHAIRSVKRLVSVIFVASSLCLGSCQNMGKNGDKSSSSVPIGHCHHTKPSNMHTWLTCSVHLLALASLPLPSSFLSLGPQATEAETLFPRAQHPHNHLLAKGLPFLKGFEQEAA